MNKMTPRSKAASLSLDNLDVSSMPQRSVRASLGTAPGQAMQNVVLRGEMATMQAELDKFKGASPARRLDPNLVIRTKWANREEESFHDVEFKALKEEIEACGGNVQPIKVRNSKDRPGFFEIVFGHRRHQACLECGLPVLAMIEDLGDEQLFVEMDRENRQRKDLRPYEQGKMYAHALDEGLFPSAKKMSEAIGLHLGNIGLALKLARLPEEVLDAFPKRLDLQYRWASDLADAVEERGDEVKALALKIRAESPRPSAKEVFERLIRKEAQADPGAAAFKVQVAGGSGQKAVINVDPAANSISVSLKNIDARRASDLEALIKQFIA